VVVVVVVVVVVEDSRPLQLPQCRRLKYFLELFVAAGLKNLSDDFLLVEVD
jgi:hypothetical protein